MPDDLPATAAAVVLAGGSGTRVGADRNKVYLPLGGRHVLSWSLRAFARADGFGRLILVVRPADRELAAEAIAGEVGAPVELVEGGSSRHDSEWQALRHLAPAIRSGHVDIVAIHDGARPLVDRRLIEDVVAAARRYGAAVPGLPVRDAATVDPALGVLGWPASRPLMRMQTPQAFHAPMVLDAYEQAAIDGFAGTDTAACVQRCLGRPVHCVAGDPTNLKITYQRDLGLAERLLAGRGPGG